MTASASKANEFWILFRLRVMILSSHRLRGNDKGAMIKLSESSTNQLFNQSTNQLILVAGWTFDVHLLFVSQGLGCFYFLGQEIQIGWFFKDIHGAEFFGRDALFFPHIGRQQDDWQVGSGFF